MVCVCVCVCVREQELDDTEDDDGEDEGQRTALFTAILEDSTVLFCSACELCQKVLQRLQAQWQRLWVGIEHMAELPGGKRLEREWECMNYWCECEATETASENSMRTQLQELARDRDRAIQEVRVLCVPNIQVCSQGFGLQHREEEADRLEDAYWDLDWHLYELQWERIDWRFKVLEEQALMLGRLLGQEKTVRK